MRLKVTLVRADHSSDDLVVTADAATTIGEVARTVASRDPRAVPGAAVPAELTLHAQLPGQDQPVLLPPDAALGEAWIGSGARLSLVDNATYRANVASDRTPRASVRVVEGPDAGRSVDLPEGSYVVGRAPGVDLILSDRLASKRHARIDIGETIEVVDLGSANGVVADGAFVTRLRVEQAVRVQLGDTHLVVEPHAARANAGVVAKAGPVPFNRSPKVEARYPGETFKAPEPPTETEEQPFPLLALLAPILLGLGMFAITQRPTSLLFVVMSPLMMIGNHVTAKRRAKARLEKDVAKFEDRLQGLRDSLAAEEKVERSARLVEAPATPLVYAEAMRRGPVLWTRRPEHWSFLNVRFGIGTMPSRCTVDTPGKGEMLAEFQERLDELVDAHSDVSGVPVVENLFDAGALGVAGGQQHVLGSLNALLVQLTALHSPAELVVAAMVSPYWTSSLRWLTWLPHTSSSQSPLEGTHLADSAGSAGALLAQLEELVRARTAAQRAGSSARRGAVKEDDSALDRGADVSDGKLEGTKAPLPAVVVVISGDVDVDRSRLAQLAEAGADAGVFPIWVAPDVQSLPAACRTYLEVGAGVARVGLVRLGRTIDDLVPEVVAPDAALEYGRRMAPVFDAGAYVEDASDIPRSVSLVTLLGHDMAEQSDAVVDRWRQNRSLRDRTAAPTRRKAGSLRAIVGSAGVDAMQLDLRTQGPHALVGGTTGSGKSEFLQAWVLGMAAEYSPDRVTFLFVDYKGGSAFAECTNLPHCVGLVTDLSQHLVRRALTSLRAELYHREHLFNRKKAKDLLELEKRGDPDAPPALVIVIDEFAALVGDVPEFVDGVVDVAQRGRSLGIHLVMATQRPAGVIKDNLRANTNLRIALRMADESDSSDVVGVADAAHFDPAIPGRGMAKTGPGRLQVFQSAYAGGWTSTEQKTAGIEVAALRFGGEVRWEEPEGSVVEVEEDLGPNDQERLVRTIVAAAQRAQLEEPRRPWLDELAGVYDLVKLPQRTDTELLLGVADHPERQAQVPVYFNPDTDGHMGVYGTGGSGKSTVLRTIATAAGITPRGGPVHVYALDFAAGSLRMLDELPHVGAVIKADDVERTVRLFRTLREELDRRGPAFADASASSITEYRRLTGKLDVPRILLLVDGFPSFRDDYEVGAGRAPWYEVFRDVLAEGRQLGIHVILTADRAGAVPTSVRSAVQRNVVLRLADDSYGMFDVPSDILSTTSPVGRAIYDGTETQIAVVGGSGSVAEQARATARLAVSMQRAGVRPAPAIGALPKEYKLSELPSEVRGMPALGVSDVDLGAFGWDPAGTFLVAGPPSSGRTNALAVLAGSVRRFDPATRCYHVGPARSPLRELSLWAGTATGLDEVGQLARDLAAAMTDPDTEGRIAVFFESYNEYLNSSADGAIVTLVKAAKASGHLVVAEGESSGWGAAWPLLAEIKNGRRGLLLQPETAEGENILKAPLPRITRSEFPPGRGYYIARGQATRVQIPLDG